MLEQGRCQCPGVDKPGLDDQCSGLSRPLTRSAWIRAGALGQRDLRTALGACRAAWHQPCVEGVKVCRSTLKEELLMSQRLLFSLGVALAAAAGPTAALADDAVVPVGVERLFVPRGFDDNDSAQIV